ncbi:hypothetical protein B9Z65_4163 [Elsinoe australis]|uniref:Uncharacterized protein n=1 Tax=Elsinoe australis TaxID=40998 RepID=A0A2P7Z203_9PEZI|nr:hypothetical protein B9Z65_4163 [Elsinoe australis]
MRPSYSVTLSLLATLGAALDESITSSIDPNNPNNADPTPLPTVVAAAPSRQSDDPWPSGIPTLPNGCDGRKMTAECFSAMDASAQSIGKGAYLWFDNDHRCTAEQQNLLKTGFRESEDVLSYVSNWQNTARGRVAADYWMGSTWIDLVDRIGGNIKRASDFINEPGSKKSYITISCADKDNTCQRARREGKAVGGYAWNYKGWWGYVYGYINMCDSYYSLADIPTKEDEINGYLRSGDGDRLQDMRYFRTLGQFLIHEMFHLKSTSGSEPDIHDQYITNIPWDSSTTDPNDKKAYGPKLVRKVAKQRYEGNGGGAIKSSQNADSYAIMAQCLYWWDVTGVFPGVPVTSTAASQGAPPVMHLLSLDLDNGTDIDTASNGGSAFDSVFNSFSGTFGDSQDSADTDTSNDSPVVSSTSSSPAASSPTSAPAPAPPKEVQTCNGVGGGHYVSQPTLSDIITNKFCPDAVAQGTLDTNSGSISRSYNPGTMEAVSVSMDWAPGLDFKPNLDDCKQYLLARLTDGCDGNDPTGNPVDYKAGGSMVVGDVTYRITPTAIRQPATDGIKARCDSTYKAAFNEYWTWGHGFASDDFGARFKHELGGCAILPDTWSFDYGLGSDGREWTAKFRTGVFQRSCVGNAFVTAGAPSGTGCNGSG